jgi:hypothetical protein
VPVQSAATFDETRTFLFGGFAYARSAGDLGDFNWLGFQGQVASHVTDWLAIAGDFSYHFTDIEAFGVNLIDVNYSHFTAGPQFGNRTGRVRGFSNVLFGGGRLGGKLAGGLGGSESDTGFATTIGGGLDIAITEHFGVRPIEVDWLRVWKGDGFNLTRISFGVVGRF